ncbi:MAG TPA: PQQ-binding-like beta-propeller repeat protein, partial [Pseudonocardiaceae bacterium]
GPEVQSEQGRRVNPFRRPVDYIVAVFILVASLVVGIVLWARSDIHNTVVVMGPPNAVTPASPTTFPPSLAEFWSQPSPATAGPVVIGPTVVTAGNGAVVGRDPLTGDQRWSYARDLPLCTVSSAFEKVIAVYHRSNCNEVTELDPTTGAIGAQRNGDAQLGTRLVSDGTYVTTTGPTLLNTWRSDLVLTMEYGTVPDFVNPNVQPRVGCDYGSVAAYAGVIGVIERCPKENTDRLTVYKATANDADKPTVVFTTQLGVNGSRLVTMNQHYVAVAMSGPDRLEIFNAQNGSDLTRYPLSLTPRDLSGDPLGLVVPVTVGPGAIYWYTGSSTVALSTTNLQPMWTVPNSLGAGVVFAGRYLVPVPNGIEVADQVTGAKVGVIGVDRHGYTGQVAMAALGPVVFEQRGPVLAALH